MFQSRLTLGKDLKALGIESGDTVMVHAALRSVGAMLNGPDALIDALLDSVGPTGTVVAYTDWDALYEDMLDDDGRLPDLWKPHIPPFDPARSRACRDYGAFAEFLRTRPEARRSGNPGASIAAIGAMAEALTADHSIDYGYGEGSPFARLVALGGKVAMIGAPLDTMTLLHHSEHLADIPGKRVRRTEVPFATPGGVTWRRVEEFDTADPVVEGLADTYFGDIVRDYLASGSGVQGQVGGAATVVVPAAGIVRFAVEWLQGRVISNG